MKKEIRYNNNRVEYISTKMQGNTTRSEKSEGNLGILKLNVLTRLKLLDGLKANVTIWEDDTAYYYVWTKDALIKELYKY